MKVVKFVTHWVALGGRHVRLTVGGIVQVYVCSECAALVVHQERHAEWHGRSER